MSLSSQELYGTLGFLWRWVTWESTWGRILMFDNLEGGDGFCWLVATCVKGKKIQLILGSFTAPNENFVAIRFCSFWGDLVDAIFSQKKPFELAWFFYRKRSGRNLGGCFVASFLMLWMERNKLVKLLSSRSNNQIFLCVFLLCRLVTFKVGLFACRMVLLLYCVYIDATNF